MKAIGKLLTSFGTTRSRSSSPNVRLNANQDALAYTVKCSNGLKKAITYLENHLTSSRGLFEQSGKPEEWNALEDFIQKDNLSDSFLQTLSSMHSLANAIKMIFMKYEPLIPSTHYVSFMNANENDFDRLIDDISHVHHGLFEFVMKFLWRLAFQHRALRTDISVIASNLGIYILRPNNSNVAFAPPLDSKETQERSETFMEVLSHFAKRNRANPHPHTAATAHAATSSTASTTSPPAADIAVPVASIQDRSCKVLFLNPNNRPTQEALRHALAPYGHIINIGFKEKLAVVLFGEVEGAVRSALDQDGKCLGPDFKVKYLGAKTTNDLLVPPQSPAQIQALHTGNQVDLNPVDQEVLRKDTPPMPPSSSDTTHGKPSTAQRPSLTAGIAVDESFRNHHQPPVQGNEASIATIDVSHISKADESMQGNHILDASAIPPNSIKKPKQKEGKEKVRYRYATSSDDEDEEKHNSSTSTKKSGSDHSTTSDDGKASATKSGWNVAKPSTTGWKTATRSMENIPQAIAQEKEEEAVARKHETSDEVVKDNISVTSASSQQSSSNRNYNQDKEAHIKSSNVPQSLTPAKASSRRQETNSKLNIETDPKEMSRHQSPTATKSESHDPEILNSPMSVGSEGSFKRRRQIKKIKVGSPSLRSSASYDEGDGFGVPSIASVRSHHSEITIEDVVDQDDQDDNESSYLEEELTPSAAAALRSSGEEQKFKMMKEEKHNFHEPSSKAERRRPSTERSKFSDEESDKSASQSNHHKPQVKAQSVKEEENSLLGPKLSPSPFPHERQEYHSSTQQYVPTNNHKRVHHSNPAEDNKREQRIVATTSNNKTSSEAKVAKKEKDSPKASKRHPSNTSQQDEDPKDDKLMKYAALAEKRQQRQQEILTPEEVVEDLSKQELIRKLRIAEGKCLTFQKRIAALETYIEQEGHAFQTTLVHVQIENSSLQEDKQALQETIQQKTMELMNKNALIASLEASKDSMNLSMKQMKDKLQRESYQVLVSQQQLIDSLESHLTEIQQQKKNVEEELKDMQQLLQQNRQEYLDYKAKMTKQQNLLVFEYEAKRLDGNHPHHSTEEDEEGEREKDDVMVSSPQKVQFAVSSSSGSSPNLSPRLPMSPPHLNKRQQQPPVAPSSSSPSRQTPLDPIDPVYHQRFHYDDKPKRKGDRSSKLSSASPSPSKSPNRKHVASQKKSPSKQPHKKQTPPYNPSAVDQFLEEHKQPDLKSLRTVTKDEVAKFIESIPALKEQLQSHQGDGEHKKEAWAPTPSAYQEPSNRYTAAPSSSSAASNGGGGGYLDIVTKYDGSYSNPYDGPLHHVNKPKYSEQVLANVAKGYQYRKQYNFHMQMHGKENSHQQQQPVPGAFGQKNDLTDVKNYLATLQASKQLHNSNSYQHRMSYYNHLRSELGEVTAGNQSIGIDRRGIGQHVDTSTTNPFASKVNLSTPVPMDQHSMSYDTWRQHQH